MADKAIPKDIRSMTFEGALAELESIVRGLEDGSGELDEAIKSYERGAALKRHCEAKLMEAQARIEKVIIGPEGPQGVEPADAE